MHEIGLMQAAVAVAVDQAQTQGAKQIHRLQLQVGALSGVDPEALAFAFDVVSHGTLAEQAELELIPVPAVCYCAACQRLFQPQGWVYACPDCQRVSGDIRQGTDLELTSLEMS